MRLPGVYCITNSRNGKRYIGSSYNAKARITQHFKMLRYGKHHNSHLQAAFNKYGSDSFSWRILVYCEEFELIRYEQFFIDSDRPEYNKHPIAGRTTGAKQSDSAREKIRQSKQNISPETRERMSESAKGKQISDKTRRIMSLAHKGKKHNLSEEGRAAIARKNLEYRHSPASLAKIGEASRNRSPECIEKNRVAHIGKQISEETREKMRDAQRRRYANPEELERQRERARERARALTPEDRAKLSEVQRGKHNKRLPNGRFARKSQSAEVE